MPIVNYVREHVRFIEYASDEHLTASERLVWYALMHIMNQRAQGNIWPDEFIRVSNDRLLSFCPMKFDTMAAARNSLKQRGLIDMIPGEKNKKSPAYRMIYFYPQYARPETERDGESNPEKSDYIGDNMGGNMGDNIGDNTGGNMGDIYINNTKGVTYTHQNPVEPHTQGRNNNYQGTARVGTYTGLDGEEKPCRYDNGWAFSLRARKAVAGRIMDGYKGKVQPASHLYDYILDALGYGMTPELIEDIGAACDTAYQFSAHLLLLARQRGYITAEEA